MGFFETVGALTVGSIGLTVALVALEIVREARRSFRQSCRVARYTMGKGWKSPLWVNRYRWKFMRQFLRQWGHNFGGGEFSINGLIFPADPSKPFRRSWTRD